MRLMKIVGIAFGAALAVGVALTGAAQAQVVYGQPQYQQPVQVSPLNCEAVSGTPLICVVNKSPFPIRDLTCTGFWGTAPLTIPGGIIPSGGIAVVNFSRGSCDKLITVRTGDGKTHNIPAFNTSRATMLYITPDSGW